MKKFKIAVLPGDGIGNEITRPSMYLVAQVANQCGVELDSTYLETGAALYQRTGNLSPKRTSSRLLRLTLFTSPRWAYPR